MSRADNKEKYKEYDHQYYIKHKRPKSKIGQAEQQIADLEAKLAKSEKQRQHLQHKLKVSEIATKLACENISFENPCDYCKYTKEVGCPMDCKNNKNFARDIAIKHFIEEAKEMLENE